MPAMDEAPVHPLGGGVKKKALSGGGEAPPPATIVRPPGEEPRGSSEPRRTMIAEAPMTEAELLTQRF